MFHYDNWDDYVLNNRRILKAIIVTHDITPDKGKLILAQLDNIYSDIRIVYGDVMKAYSEIENLIARIEAKNRTGKNDIDRKANGIIAVENAERGSGETINLYDIYIDINNKKEDLESLLDIIKSKNSLVITMSGLLKIESNIGKHS